MLAKENTGHLLHHLFCPKEKNYFKLFLLVFRIVESLQCIFKQKFKYLLLLKSLIVNIKLNNEKIGKKFKDSSCKWIEDRTIEK